MGQSLSDVLGCHFSSPQLSVTLCTVADKLLCPWDFSGKNTGVGCYALLRGSFRPRDRTRVSCITCNAGRFFTAEPSGRPPCLIHMLKVRLLKLQVVITSSESSYITQHLSWAYLLRMKRTSSFYFGPSLAFEQKMRLIKAQHLVLDQQTAPGVKAPAIVKSDQVRANWLQKTLIFKARLAFGSFCDSYRKRFHSSLTWWPACKLLWVSLLLNPYCSIVRKACKQEAPSVTSECFEQTNIITRVFMEKCLSTEAERA